MESFVEFGKYCGEERKTLPHGTIICQLRLCMPPSILCGMVWGW